MEMERILPPKRAVGGFSTVPYSYHSVGYTASRGWNRSAANAKFIVSEMLLLQYGGFSKEKLHEAKQQGSSQRQAP
jgi:hypothetical protein